MRPPALTECRAYQALQAHHLTIQDISLRDLFAKTPDRFSSMSAEAAGLFLDYSKNRITEETMGLLLDLARECQVELERDAMFAGKKINNTEHRSVLHTALRAPRGQNLVVGSHDVGRDVHAVLDRLQSFTERVRSGQWLGHDGKPITDVVNIGIGGSDLGPKMATQALRPFGHPRLRMHFVSNVDGHALDAVLSEVDADTTLFIVASKTFTTLETMTNANTARRWFLQHAPENALAKHFVAISTNTQAIVDFGIDPENMFPFWEWVGGRYSVWSAIGLPVALAIGFDQFQQFLAGAHAMDSHFCQAPLERNLPVLLGLVGFWNRNFLGCGSLSIAPYHQDLAYLPGYLQQLEMESNGKRVTRTGEALDVAACPVIWGDVGTNGQHAYFQLLHQGTDVTPLDFIAALSPSHDLPSHHAILLANCFAQSEALMRGKTAEEVRADLQAQKLPEEEIQALLPHKVFPGNRPSNTILMDKLTPATLGALIALYEHKTFVQGVLWDVNSFDQWGVELGKVLAKDIQAEIEGQPHPERHDSSTSGLIAMARDALR